MYVACEGMSDLGNGPNKPTATIIGEYSTSYHDGALIYPLEYDHHNFIDHTTVVVFIHCQPLATLETFFAYGGVEANARGYSRNKQCKSVASWVILTTMLLQLLYNLSCTIARLTQTIDSWHTSFDYQS